MKDILEYDEIHHNDPVQVTDEISITYFPNTLIASARASDLVYSGKVDYHGYDVGKFTVGGKVAFCIQHNKYVIEKVEPDTRCKIGIMKLQKEYCISDIRVFSHGVNLKMMFMLEY